MHEDVPTLEQRQAVYRWAANQRKRVEGACLRCGETFTATTRRRYCSLVCRVAAHRAKRRAQPQAAEP